ncbi:hypothetical protein F5Y16DRAFT_360255 [Xylariaceae sp. FL0255]|nr:hypothetical protein F5Y16DRAFT_360255 [Xylariaceae sp. FL0255]
MQPSYSTSGAQQTTDSSRRSSTDTTSTSSIHAKDTKHRISSVINKMKTKFAAKEDKPKRPMPANYYPDALATFRAVAEFRKI